MPNFDHIAHQGKSLGSQGKYSYTKILATWNPLGSSSGIAAKSSRMKVSFKEASSFNDSLIPLDSTTFLRTAGADISNIFMPYETISNNISGIPGFLPTIDPTHSIYTGIPSGNVIGASGYVGFDELLPMYWDRTASGTLTDRWFSPSGDCLNGFISSNQYYGNLDRYRDDFDMRGIGMRLPMMGVGWGYTSDGGIPFPSGSRPMSDGTDGYPSGTMFFKGNYTKGWMVDPADYVAAPIDFRYDLQRNCWTCNSLPMGQGLFKVLMLIDDLPNGTAVYDYPRFSS